MDFKVRDLLELFTEDCQSIELYDADNYTTVFEGTADEASLTEYAEWEIASIDTLFNPTEVLVINIYNKEV